MLIWISRPWWIIRLLLIWISTPMRIFLLLPLFSFTVSSPSYNKHLYDKLLGSPTWILFFPKIQIQFVRLEILARIGDIDMIKLSSLNSSDEQKTDRWCHMEVDLHGWRNNYNFRELSISWFSASNNIKIEDRSIIPNDGT